MASFMVEIVFEGEQAASPQEAAAGCLAWIRDKGCGEVRVKVWDESGASHEFDEWELQENGQDNN